MKKRNDNLDERQEQILLHIEHNACWGMFWGLLAAMLVQKIFFADGHLLTIGEWIVFMGAAIYMTCACIRNGIWDRRFTADNRTNLILSLIVGTAVGVIMMIVLSIRIKKDPVLNLAVSVFTGLGTFALCLAALSIAKLFYRKRKETLENEQEVNDE